MNDNAALAPPNPFLSTILDWLHDLPPGGPVDDGSSGDRLVSWRQLACAGMTEEHLQALFLLRLARWACPESPHLDGDPMVSAGAQNQPPMGA